MSMIWIGVLVLAAPPLGVPSSTAATAGTATPAVSSSATPGAQAGSPQARLGSGRKLADAVHAALQRRAHANEKNAEAAAREFLVLYKELRADKRLAIDERGELRGLVRGRLVRLSKMIAAAAARHAPSAQQQPGAVAKLAQPAAVLAQAAAGGGAAGLGPGGAGKPDDDYGPSLVELIETTIAPDTWDVNGGPGSIYYWRNQHALVIRATAEVHGVVGDLMDQLDAAGH